MKMAFNLYPSAKADGKECTSYKGFTAASLQQTAYLPPNIPVLCQVFLRATWYHESAEVFRLPCAGLSRCFLHSHNPPFLHTPTPFLPIKTPNIKTNAPFIKTFAAFVPKKTVNIRTNATFVKTFVIFFKTNVTFLNTFIIFFRTFAAFVPKKMVFIGMFFVFMLIKPLSLACFRRM